MTRVIGALALGILVATDSCYPEPPAGSVKVDVAKRIVFIKDANTQECLGVALYITCESCSVDAWVVPDAYCTGQHLPIVEPERRR